MESKRCEKQQELSVSERLYLFVDIFPNNIKLSSSENADGASVGYPVSKLLCEPNWEQTWYHLPVVVNEVSGVSEQSDWKDYKKGYPSFSANKPSGLLPKDPEAPDYDKSHLLSLSPELVFPPNVHKFLKGPVLVKGLAKRPNQGSYESKGKVELGSVPWSKCSELDIQIDKRIVDSEKLIRESQRESLGAHQMLSLMAHRLNQDLDRSNTENWSIDDWRQEISLCSKWTELAMLPTKRAFATASGAELNIKSHIRDKALDQLHGGREERSTKESLRHSHYGSRNLFGPMAKEHLDHLADNNPNREAYLLDNKPKSWFRQGDKAPNPQFKRQNPSYYNTSNKSNKTQRGGSVLSRISHISPSQAAQNNAQRNFWGAQSQKGGLGGQKSKGRRGK